MKKVWLAAGLAVMLCQGSSASADDLKARDISGRIKELRDRLSQFQSRGEEKLTETTTPPPKEQDPEKLTDQLEHRRDARMLVLFHDRGSLAEGAPGGSHLDKDSPEAASEEKTELSLAEQALKRLRESRQARQTRLAKATVETTTSGK